MLALSRSREYTCSRHEDVCTSVPSQECYPVISEECGVTQHTECGSVAQPECRVVYERVCQAGGYTSIGTNGHRLYRREAELEGGEIYRMKHESFFLLYLCS